MVSISAESTTFDRASSIRRAGWLLIAAAVTFVGSLLFLFVVGADYYRELTDAADAAGKSLAGVPEVERARIAGRHGTFFVASVPLFLIPYVVLALALWDIRRAMPATDDRTVRLTLAAWLGGLACLVLWVALSVLEFGLLADPANLPPLVRDFNALVTPLTTGAAIVGACAVGCAALAIRQAQIAPRIALATAIIVGLFLLVTLVESVATGELAEVPQFLPLIPAPLLGIGLARAGRFPAA